MFLKLRIILWLYKINIFNLGKYYTLRYLVIKGHDVLCLATSDSLRPHELSYSYSPLSSSVHGDSPGKNTGVGCHALLQGIFPI